MISLIKEKVSIGIVILISLVIAVAPNIAEYCFEKKEKRREYFLNQVNTYGTLYYIYHTGSPKELARYLKQNVAYIDEEDINIFYSILKGTDTEAFTDRNDIPIMMFKTYDENLAKMLLEKYKERLNRFRDDYL